MTDYIDHAQALEQQHRDQALQRRVPRRQPKNEDGRCINCREQIPAARLAARPDAQRCIDCEQDWEKAR